MGTGKKRLDAGEDTPEHSTGRYHELVFAIEGQLTVKIENMAQDVKLSPGQACYIPPNSNHSVANTGSKRACCVFVYSLPKQAQEHGERFEQQKNHAN